MAEKNVSGRFGNLCFVLTRKGDLNLEIVKDGVRLLSLSPKSTEYEWHFKDFNYALSNLAISYRNTNYFYETALVSVTDRIVESRYKDPDTGEEITVKEKPWAQFLFRYHHGDIVPYSSMQSDRYVSARADSRGYLSYREIEAAQAGKKRSELNPRRNDGSLLENLDQATLMKLRDQGFDNLSFRQE